MGNVSSCLSFCIYLSIFLFNTSLSGDIVESQVTLTTSDPGNPSTDRVWATQLVSDLNWISDSNRWHCEQDLYSLCTYLTIKDECEYKSVIKIGIYATTDNNDVDLFSIFSYTNETDYIDRYFTILNDWDGAVAVGYGNNGGVFFAVSDNNKFFMVDNDSGSILNLLDDNDPSIEPVSNEFIRYMPAGGDPDNYEYQLLTGTKVGKAKPVYITLENDRYLDETTVYFKSQGVAQKSFLVKGTFPSGSNIIANFFSDHLDSMVAFEKFEFDYTCHTAPTNSPTSAPTPGCEYTEVCSVWGDPHIRTFDGTLFHFMGEGYFDYVKSCDLTNDYRLPFSISARHDYTSLENTCVKEVIVTMSDGNIISFAEFGNPINKETEKDAIGTYSYTDILNGELVVYEIEESNFEVFFKYNDHMTMLKFEFISENLIIETSDCLFGNINVCGLCGNINNDKTDDFMNCQTLDIIDNKNSATAWSKYKGEPWVNSQIFGESCCNIAFDTAYLDESDCGEELTYHTV